MENQLWFLVHFKQHPVLDSQYCKILQKVDQYSIDIDLDLADMDMDMDNFAARKSMMMHWEHRHC